MRAVGHCFFMHEPFSRHAHAVKSYCVNAAGSVACQAASYFGINTYYIVSNVKWFALPKGPLNASPLHLLACTLDQSLGKINCHSLTVLSLCIAASLDKPFSAHADLIEPRWQICREFPMLVRFHRCRWI
jgi:hypothetical protein